MRIVNEIQSIAAYNTRDKEPIGFFKNASMAARYIFTLYDNSKSTRLMYAMRCKVNMSKGTRFSFPVAVRKCTIEQHARLGKAPAITFEGYPVIMYNSKGSGIVVVEKNY